MADESLKNSDNIFMQIIEFAQSYSAGLTVLWTIVCGLVVALLLFLKHIYGDKKENSNPDSTPVVVINFDKEYLQENFRKRIEEEFGGIKSNIKETPEKTFVKKNTTLGLNVPQAIEQLSNLRSILKPSDLSSDVFPVDLKILNFDQNRNLKLQVLTSKVEVISSAINYFFVYIVFPFTLVALFSQSLILSVVSALIGAFIWYWFHWRCYISINLEKKSYSINQPSGFDYQDGFPSISLSTWQEGSKWKTILSIAGGTVIERESNTEENYHDIEQFVQALKWRFGDLVEITEGVFMKL